jgi:LytTr DNA-binding domain
LSGMNAATGGNPDLVSLAQPGADAGSARIAFWIGFPLVLGLFSGWNQIGMIAPFLAPVWSVIYWLLLSAIMWAGLGFGTLIASRVPSPLPFWASLLLGAMIGVAATRPVHAAFQSLFIPLTSGADGVRALPVIPISIADWVLLYRGNAMLMLFWIGGALFFARFLGYAPLRQSIPRIPMKQPFAAPSQPSLLAGRLGRLPLDDIDVIHAEDHYLRLSGVPGDELILYRFTDAVAELTPRGWTRVHRSYAVRDAAVQARRAHGRHVELIMSGDQRVPVSERYWAITEKLG